MTTITAITAQNENKVYDVHFIPIEIIKKQIEVTINCANAIKTGMLGNKEIIEVVTSLLSKNIPIVVDPVMFTTSGYQLISQDAIQILKNKLLPKSLIVTPNIPEAESLSNLKIINTEDMIKAGKEILKFGVKTVLMKGGHLIQKNKISDILISTDEEHFFVHDAIKNTNNTHGTGCKLSAAIACNLAKGKTLRHSIENAIYYVSNCLKN